MFSIDRINHLNLKNILSIKYKIIKNDFDYIQRLKLINFKKKSSESAKFLNILYKGRGFLKKLILLLMLLTTIQ